MDDPILPRKHLYTIKWTQAYATYHMRPYLRGVLQSIERGIEIQLENKQWPEAKQLIERIRKL